MIDIILTIFVWMGLPLILLLLIACYAALGYLVMWLVYYIRRRKAELKTELDTESTQGTHTSWPE